MSQLAYYCASETKKISVINGVEKGTPLSKIKTAVKPDMLPRLKKGYHVFLDNLSGDFYSYDHDKLEWFPEGNVGLHNHRIEASIEGGQQTNSMFKTNTEKFSDQAGLIMTSHSDVKCDVRKNFLSHWIFDKVHHEFVVENNQKWDPHPITLINKEIIGKS